MSTLRPGGCGFYPHPDQTRDRNDGSHWIVLLGLNPPVISEFGTVAVHRSLRIGQICNTDTFHISGMVKSVLL